MEEVSLDTRIAVGSQTPLITTSELTCPNCGEISRATMPTDACVYFYDCAGCGALLRPRAGDCCVFCSYGSVPCPPVQTDQSCCNTQAAGAREPIRGGLMQERNKIIASGGSAVGLSMFASFVGLCCVGPWTVALLGVSGAVSMARWQPFRPYILSIAGAMLAWAFWRTYRLNRVCLAEGCTDKRPGAAMHVSLWLSALLLVLAVFAEQLQWLLVDPTPAALR